MRGRLIFPCLLEVASLDTAATEAAVATNAGYDADFHEPVRVDDGSLLGVSTRTEVTRFVRAQIEPAQFDKMHRVAAGDARDAMITCIAHYKELEDNDWVLPDGTTVFRVNDRLVSIRGITGLDPEDEPIILGVPASPGLYLREALPLGFGFPTGKRNLLALTFMARVTARP